MDINFNCPHCTQDLTVDESMAGAQLECPKCAGQIVIPTVEAAAAARVAAPPPAGGAGASREHKHFAVPQRDRKQPEKLLSKPVKSLELAAKQSSTLRVKTFRRLDCMEGDKDTFDDVVGKFLTEVGEGNLVKVESFQYSRSEASRLDHGLVVIYRI
jgi:DNA-directed RNA polymerase subunit RPC12/RpoP